LRRALSVGRLDLRHPRACEVLELAREAGVPAVKRLGGGRAAALGSGCLCLGWAQPNPRMGDSGSRYELTATVIVQALGKLGVIGTLAEAQGEWCPGAWSVQGRGGKLAGLAQRVISGGAWCEALIVIERDPTLTSLGRRVHEVLELPWGEEAQGELARLLPGRADLHRALGAALVDVLSATWRDLGPEPLPESVHARARELADEHRL
jgi:octanoyl-[GcvH]:protein N-octanoyltransferase